MNIWHLLAVKTVYEHYSKQGLETGKILSLSALLKHNYQNTNSIGGKAALPESTPQDIYSKSTSNS